MRGNFGGGGGFGGGRRGPGRGNNDPIDPGPVDPNPTDPDPTDPGVVIGGIRPVDGVGTNPDNPDFGSTGAQLIRLAEAHYADGLGELVTDRPDPRVITNELQSQIGDIPNALGASNFLWAWGQFIDHDLDLTEAGSTEPAPIAVPAGDPFFDPAGTGTAEIPFTRAEPIEGTGETGPREFANEITTFLDASMIYGSTQEVLDSLRTEGGKLLLDENGNLTVDAEGNILTGDIRAGENLVLLSLHTTFTREHNRLVDELAARDPSLTDDELFQAARSRVEAMVQAVTFNEFLPFLVGENTIAEYRGFDPNVNPGISVEFSTAVFRLGHTLLSPEILRLQENGETAEGGNLALRDAFLTNPELLEASGGVDPLLRGLAAGSAQDFDLQVIDDVRNFLFGPPGAGGIDLPATNIQRGRDLGLPTYNELREALGLGRAESFDEITSDPELAAKLEQVYGDVDLIDLYIGGLAEDPVNGGLLGETFAAIVVDQFQRLRDGDPFFSLNSDIPQEELDALWSTTLSDVIQNNTDVDFLQDDVFSVFDRIAGDDGDNQLLGGDGRDLIIGFAGTNILEGDAGDDQIFGGTGNDVIAGGSGSDILIGGGGNNTFVFGLDEGSNVIRDFAAGQDVIDVSAAVTAARFADLSFEEIDNGVVLALDGGGTVTFEGISLEDLDEDNFLLSA